MTEKTRAQTFGENQPDLSEEDALRALADDKAVLSFQALPVMGTPPHIGFFTVRLVLADGTVQTIGLDRFAGELLHAALGLLKDGDWKATQTTPDGTKLN